MYKLVLGLIVTFATALAVPAVSAAKSAPKDQAATAEKSETAPPLDKDGQQKLKEHLRMRNHIAKGVKYPATKEKLVAAFKGFRDVKPDDRKWFDETLPDKTYETSEDVMKALGWEVTPAASATAGNGK